MKAERLQALADAYGADLRRWPVSERAFAESLIAGEPSLRAVLDDAAGLDVLLAAAPVVAPSADLTARILAAAPRRKGRGRLGQAIWFWERAGRRRPAPALSPASVLPLT